MQLIDKRGRGTIDQHSLHAEAATRGCGGEIARVDGRRTKPARHPGVQRDPVHASTSMTAIGQLLACGTFVSTLNGITGGSGGFVAASR